MYTNKEWKRIIIFHIFFLIVFAHVELATNDPKKINVHVQLVMYWLLIRRLWLLLLNVILHTHTHMHFLVSWLVLLSVVELGYCREYVPRIGQIANLTFNRHLITFRRYQIIFTYVYDSVRDSIIYVN
jgi:hypothetical protein